MVSSSILAGLLRLGGAAHDIEEFEIKFPVFVEIA
jgi:hypothetical protein